MIPGITIHGIMVVIIIHIGIILIGLIIQDTIGGIIMDKEFKSNHDYYRDILNIAKELSLKGIEKHSRIERSQLSRDFRKSRFYGKPDRKEVYNKLIIELESMLDWIYIRMEDEVKVKGGENSIAFTHLSGEASLFLDAIEEVKKIIK